MHLHWAEGCSPQRCVSSHLGLSTERQQDDLNGDHLQPGEQALEVTAEDKEVCKTERMFLAMRLFGSFNKLPREELFLWITVRRDREKCF